MRLMTLIKTIMRLIMTYSGNYEPLIDKVAPIKEMRVKQNSQEWFDGEIANEIKNCDKLFKKFKKSKLHIAKDIYNAARYKVRKMIFNKKRSFFEK